MSRTPQWVRTLAGGVACICLGTALRAIAEQPLSSTPTLANGPLFAPTGPGTGRFRLGIGGFFDFLDENALAGYHIAAPQFTTNVRWGLGPKFSLLGHLNTIVVSNQLEVGAGWTEFVGPISVMARLYAGALFGKLGSFGFDAFSISPIIRPGIVAGIPIDDHWLSFAIDVLLIPVQHVVLGDSSIGITSYNAFAGMSFELRAEAMLNNGGAVFYGGGLMWTRANYQVWLLFGDESNLLAYPRVFAGYEF